MWEKITCYLSNQFHFSDRTFFYTHQPMNISLWQEQMLFMRPTLHQVTRPRMTHHLYKILAILKWLLVQVHSQRSCPCPNALRYDVQCIDFCFGCCSGPDNATTVFANDVFLFMSTVYAVLMAKICFCHFVIYFWRTISL